MRAVVLCCRGGVVVGFGRWRAARSGSLSSPDGGTLLPPLLYAHYYLLLNRRR